MARVMRTYSRAVALRASGERRLLRGREEVSGQDLTPFFKQTIEGADILDYEVSSVAAVQLESGGTNGLAAFESSVLVRRLGGVTVPVEIAVKFEGEGPERVTWDGQDEWKKLTFRRPSKIEWARVDPGMCSGSTSTGSTTPSASRPITGSRRSGVRAGSSGCRTCSGWQGYDR